MKKINFQNNITKLNKETMDTFQDNIEEAIEGYDMYKQSDSSLTTPYCLVAEYVLPGVYKDFSDTIVFNRSHGNYGGQLSSIIVNITGRYDNENSINVTINYMTPEIYEKKYEIVAVKNIIEGVGNIKIYIKTHRNVDEYIGKKYKFFK